VDLPELLFGGESLGWLVVFCTDGGQLRVCKPKHDEISAIKPRLESSIKF
jgi:hypothetical protein